jgi:hypothetical protein
MVNISCSHLPALVVIGWPLLMWLHTHTHTADEKIRKRSVGQSAATRNKQTTWARTNLQIKGATTRRKRESSELLIKWIPTDPDSAQL